MRAELGPPIGISRTAPTNSWQSASASRRFSLRHGPTLCHASRSTGCSRQDTLAARCPSATMAANNIRPLSAVCDRSASTGWLSARLDRVSNEYLHQPYCAPISALPEPSRVATHRSAKPRASAACPAAANRPKRPAASVGAAARIPGRSETSRDRSVEVTRHVGQAHRLCGRNSTGYRSQQRLPGRTAA